MKNAMLGWLGDAGPWAWHTSLLLLVLVNFAAVAVVVATRDRSLVNRWTGRWLAANLGLIAFGAGTPVVTGLLWLAVNALPSFGSFAAHTPK